MSKPRLLEQTTGGERLGSVGGLAAAGRLQEVGRKVDAREGCYSGDSTPVGRTGKGVGFRSLDWFCLQ